MLRDGARAFEVGPESRCCAACDRWYARRELWLGATAGLGRLASPVELDARVASALDAVPPRARSGGSPSPRLASALGALARHAAPSELDARVLEGPAPRREGGEPAPPRCARLLRSLPRPEAPAVLERLVVEELTSEAAISRRFVGDLRKPSTPRILWTRLERRGWGPRARRIAAAAVLALVLALGLSRGRGAAPAHEYDFEVVRVDSARSLDPMARSLVTALGGLGTAPGGGS